MLPWSLRLLLLLLQPAWGDAHDAFKELAAKVARAARAMPMHATACMRCPAPIVGDWCAAASLTRHLLPACCPPLLQVGEADTSLLVVGVPISNSADYPANSKLSVRVFLLLALQLPH